MVKANPKLTILTSENRYSLDQFTRQFAKRDNSLVLVPSDAFANSINVGVETADPPRFCGFQSWINTQVQSVPPIATSGLQRLIWAHTARHTDDTYGVFDKIRDTPSFPAALCECIRELKRSCVTASDLITAANTLEPGSLQRKIRAIAATYVQYESIKGQLNVTDDEDRLLRLIASSPNIETQLQMPKRLLIHGFHRLTELWMEGIRALASSGVEVSLTLAYHTSRPNLWTCTTELIRKIEMRFQVTQELLHDDCHEQDSFASHLARSFLSDDSPPPSAANSSNAILYVDAANTYQEYGTVARVLVREHRDRQIPWSRMAIVARRTTNRLNLLETHLTAMDVPFSSHRKISLTEHPMARACIHLMQSVAFGWRTEDVLGWLRTGSVGVDSVIYHRIRSMILQHRVQRGKADWQTVADSAISYASHFCLALRSVIEVSDRFRSDATMSEMCADVRALFRAWWDCGERNADNAIRKRIENVLAEMERFGRITSTSAIDLCSFARIFQEQVQAANIPGQPKHNAVSIIDAFEASSLSVDVVVIPDLVEGEFPAKARENPLLLDRERDWLRGAIGHAPELSRVAVSEEKLLFHASIHAPRVRLILANSRTSSEGDNQPSYYLDDLLDRLSQSNGGPGYELCSLQVCDMEPQEQYTFEDLDAAWLEQSRLHGLTTQGSLDGIHPWSQIPEAAGTTTIPNQLDLWSSRAIEDFNLCPFRFTAEHVWKVTAGDKAASIRNGTIVRNALQQALRDAVGVFDTDELIEIFRSALSDTIGPSELTAGSHERAMFMRSLQSDMTTLAVREGGFRQERDWVPRRLWLTFGVLDQSDQLTQSNQSGPLILEIGDGDSMLIKGTVDRIDCGVDPQLAVGLIYKSGNTMEWNRVKIGEGVQAIITMLAIEQCFGFRAAGIAIESPREPGRRLFMRTSLSPSAWYKPIKGEPGQFVKPLSEDDWNEAVGATKRAASRARTGSKNGWLTPTPGEHCRWCEFADLCRTDRNSSHDGAPWPKAVHTTLVSG